MPTITHKAEERVIVSKCQECKMLFNVRTMLPELLGANQEPNYCVYCGSENVETALDKEDTDQDFRDFLEREGE